ncbi:conserved hypothetical protein [Pediculus humanus corporis]|uniref:Uncharacterized protein n=1 Tax=Pediculus humanus subsp. corporis TaxID=121224 RepID=E0VYE6_PEDHC|nr:uncharacterized protein Phum_PHUM513350 [Pediculus humanus corporis]EEB18402.1 conserved hypothetical protein [Pediculus humanus corporis]
MGNARSAIDHPVAIEVSSGANLHYHPDLMTQIPFDVKNNLYGNAAILQPSNSITVTVTLQKMTSPITNPISNLTFYVFVQNKPFTRSAIVSLYPQTDNDWTPPKINYKFKGDCTLYSEPQNCEKGFWSLELAAQDDESGILKILSEPYGLLFEPYFMAGTKELVTAHYTATCCKSKVDFWVEDVKGNFVKQSFDVFNPIVVGVFLLLFIIVAVIVAIIFIRQKNKRSLVIPKARSSS